MSDSVTITAILVGFAVLLMLLVFLRLLLRKGPPHWTQLRMGVYIERVPNDDEEEYPLNPLPPTTYQKPE